MYRLVITEKPSAAQSIAAVLHAEKREGGFFSGGDWLVSINATRLFFLLYGPTLNIGRVVSPTLALIVQREEEISAFEPTPFYTLELNCGNITVASERLSDPAEANVIAAACKDSSAVVAAVEHTEKSEKAPALYDLTTLQRDANRLKGFTAQQTLDYLQNLYEKKLCTYPRTDSRFLTDDMENNIPDLVSAAAAVCGLDVPAGVLASQVCNSKKVTDHHAVVPTRSAAAADIPGLPMGEREILRLISLGILRAVSPPFRYAETVVKVECGGHIFSTKGKTVLDQGWKIYADSEQFKECPLPDNLAEGQDLPVENIQVKTGTTTPPKHFTEDSVLASMETAGARDIPEDAGSGQPPTSEPRYIPRHCLPLPKSSFSHSSGINKS